MIYQVLSIWGFQHDFSHCWKKSVKNIYNYWSIIGTLKIVIWGKGVNMFNHLWVYTGQVLIKMDLCALGRTADIFFFSSSFSQKDKNSKQKDSKQPPVLSCWRKKTKLLYNILLSCHKMLLLMHKVGLNAMHIRVRLRFSVRVGYEIKPFKSLKNKS